MKKLLSALLCLALLVQLAGVIPASAAGPDAGGFPGGSGGPGGGSGSTSSDPGNTDPINSISLSVGADETEMNFTWYSDSSEAGTLYVAKASELVGGEMPADARTFLATAAKSNKTDEETATDFYSNQVTVTRLEENTEYAYQIKTADADSAVYTFTTGDSDAFTFLLVGDPQLGASHDVDSDSSGWSETLEAASKNVSNAAFLLSVGDQVNTASSEEEYSAYLEQEELYGIPVATVIGNHDSSSDSYSQHFNITNESTQGSTSAGGDYWFRYGDVLFLVLNVNNMSTAEHKAFMEEAIAENTDAEWKIVAMHHSIYSVASHAVDSSILQRREELVPVFTELDIDVVLQGHDHVYCRSYMMDGLTPVTDADEYDSAEMTSVTDTDDILYVTVNSASGSKYYSIQTNLEFPYAAVMNQEHEQNYSTVSISDSAFTITTYRLDGSVVDTFTINRTTDSGDRFYGSYNRTESDRTAERYTVEVESEAEEKGSVTLSQSRAEAGQTITVTATPEEYFELKSVSVVDADGKSVSLEENRDGTYSFTMPESDVTVSAEFDWITGVLSSAAKTYTTPFTDISTSKFQTAIAYCYGEGLMEGTGETTFDPEAELTRAMVVTVLYRLSGSPIVSEASAFSDVPVGQWYSDAVVWASANGIVTGYTDGSFGPNDPVTREQLAAILYRYASAEGAYVGSTYALDGFTDSETVSSYAVTPMMWAVNNGTLVSRTVAALDAREDATRAEVANALMVLCKSVLT